MKYCTNCGNKLDNNSKFCSKCGMSLLPKNKKNNKDVLIFSLGIFLVIFSSILFGFISWKHFDNVFKIVFLSFESVLFFFLSFISFKRKSKLTGNVAYFIGYLLVPIILLLVDYYNFLPPYFNVGAGIFVYLSIISFIVLILSVISKILLKNYFYNFLSYVSILCTFAFLLNGLEVNILISYTIILLIVFIINIVSYKTKLFDFKDRFLFDLSLLVLSIISIFIVSFNNKDLLFISLICLFNSINIYYSIYKNSKSFLTGLVSIILVILFYVSLNRLFSLEIVLLLLFFFNILLYLLSYFLKSEVSRVMGLLVFLVTTLLILLESSTLYNLLLIESILLLALIIFFSKINKDESINLVLSVFIPTSIYLIIYSLFKMSIKLPSVQIILFTSIIFYLVHILFESKKHKLSRIFEIFSIIFLVATTLNFLNVSKYEITSLYLFITWLLFYISYLVKKSKNSTFFLIGSIISLFILFYLLNIEFVYSLISVSIIMILSHEFTKNKLYFTISYILILLSLFYSINYSVFLILAICFLLIYLYIKCFKNKIKVLNIFIILLGFSYIYKSLNYLIGPDFIASLITFFIYLFFIIVFYLGEFEDKKLIFVYSLFLLTPLHTMIETISYLDGYRGNINVILSLIYMQSFLLTFIKSKKTRELLLFIVVFVLSIYSIDQANTNRVFTIITNVIILLLALIRKHDLILYYSIIYLLFLLVLSLSSLTSNIIIVFVLLVLGIFLVLYTYLNESKRGEK